LTLGNLVFKKKSVHQNGWKKALHPRPDPASPVQPAFRCALKEGHGGPGVQRFFPVAPGRPLLSAGTAYRGGVQLCNN
jgi:hypothetical protein